MPNDHVSRIWSVCICMCVCVYVRVCVYVHMHVCAVGMTVLLDDVSSQKLRLRNSDSDSGCMCVCAVGMTVSLDDVSSQKHVYLYIYVCMYAWRRPA